MAIDFNGTTQWLTRTSTPVTAVPLTLACWFNSDSQTLNQYLVSISTNAALGAGGDGFALIARGAAAGDPIRAQAALAGAFGSADTSTGYTAGTWTHACAVFTSATSRDAYINGGSKGSNATSKTPSASTQINIAYAGSSSTPSAIDGRIAEVGIWNVALTADEIVALARGFSPLLIRPQSLVSYMPLVRNSVQDVKGSDFTATASPAAFAHCRVFNPRKTDLRRFTTAVASGKGPLTFGGALTHGALIRGGRLAA